MIVDIREEATLYQIGESVPEGKIVLDDLLERGFVKISRVSSDGTKAVFSLTDRGRKVAQHIREARNLLEMDP